MASIPRSVLDAMTRHQVDLARYSNSEVRRIIAILNRTDRALMEKIAAALDSLPKSASLQQIEQVLQSARTLNAAAYAAVYEGIKAAMNDLAPVEARFIRNLYRHAVPEVDFAGVTAGQARAAALSRPFQGRLLREWASGMQESRMLRVRDTVRTGYLGGETTAQIVQRLRGTRANNYADGLLEGDRRSVERVVRTALGHTAQSARQDFFDANDDILGNEVWIATLDGRTSDICRLRSGLEYTYDHKPVGHTYPYLGGPGRAHWLCRSTGLRLLKGQTKFSGTQSSQDGYVDANLTYGQWLNSQSADVQDDVLGPTRGKLFRDGGLDIQAFHNDKGRLLTLEELERRSSSAFEKAGIE